MKRILLILAVAFFSLNAFAVTVSSSTTTFEATSEISAFDKGLSEMGLEQFLSLTPKKYKEITGKKLGIAKALKLKAAQKIIKKKIAKQDGDSGLSKGLYVLLAFLGLGWLAMGLLDDFSGNNWIICLVLYALCGLPGFIYSLVKMKDYY